VYSPLTDLVRGWYIPLKYLCISLSLLLFIPQWICLVKELIQDIYASLFECHKHFFPLSFECGWSWLIESTAGLTDKKIWIKIYVYFKMTTSELLNGERRDEWKSYYVRVLLIYFSVIFKYRRLKYIYIL